MDTFLKPIVVKSPSYIRDSTDFINKIKNLSVKEGSTLVTMDVVSLYPNIDQNEGAEACLSALNSRRKPTVPSSILHKLILSILQSNIMQFGSRFFRQIKGTAMGTPMAVNFANLFMDKFERAMLDSYEEKYGSRPAVWLRFIDDVFFIWEGNSESLSQFIAHCNNFSKSVNMKSSIQFTACHSQKEVTFLDMTIRLEYSHLVTDLFSKSVDTHTYLHSKSFHPPTTISAIPKSQFIRIRRICTEIRDYERHAANYVRFFAQRGYNAKTVSAVAKEVALMDRDSLLSPKQPTRTDDDNKRVVLSLKWHPRLKFLPKALHGLYERFTEKFPNLKKTFPEPPLVAFRKNQTVRDTLVHSRSPPKLCQDPTLLNQSSASAGFKLSAAQTITNVKSNITVDTLNGESTIHERNVIYAAECTKCQLIYVGQTKQKLFQRFCGHRSDTSLRPDRCELGQHFHDSPRCNFETDLQIHILQKDVRGSRSVREAEEDKWILKLNTLSPNGMNAKTSDYGCLFSSLF